MIKYGVKLGNYNSWTNWFYKFNGGNLFSPTSLYSTDLNIAHRVQEKLWEDHHTAYKVAEYNE